MTPFDLQTGRSVLANGKRPMSQAAIFLVIRLPILLLHKLHKMLFSPTSPQIDISRNYYFCCSEPCMKKNPVLLLATIAERKLQDMTISGYVTLGNVSMNLCCKKNQGAPEGKLNKSAYPMVHFGGYVIERP